MNVIESMGDEPTEHYGLSPLHNIVYCSRVAAGIDQAAVDSIIATAHRLNPIKGITGLLVFGSGIFFQWIEGPREHVRQLMTNIGRDPRHNSIVTLNEGEEVRERLFPDWAMELVTADDIRAVLEDALESAEEAKNVNVLKQLLDELDTGEIGALVKS